MKSTALHMDHISLPQALDRNCEQVIEFPLSVCPCRGTVNYHSMYVSTISKWTFLVPRARGYISQGAALGVVICRIYLERVTVSCKIFVGE